ncbi:uncharacterized protein LOC143841844 isoform X2 [Paroedura picta]|uniref:uncharacterized protein LOC143841844 isoform X2 n=1 Tax=Paroedura picta TaxID=143630 RepID=UPI0040574616
MAKVPMSLEKEITGPQSPSSKGRIQDLPHMIQPLHESLHSMCPICLETFDNMLYLSPCLHSFCFLCTQDLLETKTECPFCNQTFRSVFHPVKVKWHPKELPSLSPTRHHKGSSPGKNRSPKKRISPKKHEETNRSPKKHISPKKHEEAFPALSPKKHPKEVCIPLHDRSHSEDPIPLACKDQSPPEHLRHPLSNPPDRKKTPLPIKEEVSPEIYSHERYSVKSPMEDDSSPGGFTDHQSPQKCPLRSVLGKNSDQASLGSMQDEKAENTTEGLPKSEDCASDSLYYRTTSAELSRPNIVEATVMLVSSSILLFVCLYSYLSLILLYK